MTLEEKILKEFRKEFTRPNIYYKSIRYWIPEKIKNPENIEKAFIKSLHKIKDEAKREVIEKIEKVFDDFRSSNQKVNGKRRFGVGNFKVGARDLYNDILNSLKEGE